MMTEWNEILVSVYSWPKCPNSSSTPSHKQIIHRHLQSTIISFVYNTLYAIAFFSFRFTLPYPIRYLSLGFLIVMLWRVHGSVSVRCKQSVTNLLLLHVFARQIISPPKIDRVYAIELNGSEVDAVIKVIRQ